MSIQAEITQPDATYVRAAMIAGQLRTDNVNAPRVLAVMAHTAREAFVPESRRSLSYTDRPIKLSEHRCMNPPVATARLLVHADVQPGETALLIGAATGYAATLLAALGANVVAVEEDSKLLTHAREALDGLTGISIVEAPLAQGHFDVAPYPLIFIDGAIEDIPQALIDQLADGGRIATAIFDRGVSRLCLGRKSDGGFDLVRFADSQSARLPGFTKPTGFVF